MGASYVHFVKEGSMLSKKHIFPSLGTRLFGNLNSIELTPTTVVPTGMEEAGVN